jgi:hypothetical protein
MNRAMAIAAVVALLMLAALLHSSVKDFLWAHPWLHSFMVAVPALVLAGLELYHSGEANRYRAEANKERIRANALGADANNLRADANDLREKANDLQAQNAELAATLNKERNEHLSKIVELMKRSPTRAQKNAEILRGHLRACVAVSSAAGGWPNPPEIVDVSDDSIVSLFTPKGYSSGQAYLVRVDCNDLEITEYRKGSCPIQMKVNAQYGTTVPLGEITKWEDRQKPAAKPVFAKGNNVAFALYEKPGASDQRIVSIHACSDGSNSFLLQTSSGDQAEADNVEISKRFMAMQIDYLNAGFVRRNFSQGNGPIQLYIS